MEPTLRQVNSFNRVTQVDVSQLDKVNAIPNKSTDNALMGGLCHTDQMYLNALIEDDSSDDDNMAPSSAWSPMAQSPIINKRMRKLRPPYAVTLSLEDISYIRPSWGISKGIKTIEINKEKRKKKPEKEKEVKDKEIDELKSSEQVYHYCLGILTIAVLLLIVPPYIIDGRRQNAAVHSNRMRIMPRAKTIEIYRPEGESLDMVQKLEFGQGIPNDLRFDQCECGLFESETKKYSDSENLRDNDSTCLTSLDWPFRANLRIYIDKTQSTETKCYKIKWQSYDTLTTPLIDCFPIGDEQWYGLGDILQPMWPLNKLRFDWTPLVTNLTAKFPKPSYGVMDDIMMQKLELGSWVNFSLFSTNGIHIGDVISDYSLSVQISHDSTSGAKRICLAARCSDTCTKIWTHEDHFKRFKMQNNFLEYKICSSHSSKDHVSNQLDSVAQNLLNEIRHYDNLTNPTLGSGNGLNAGKLLSLHDKDLRTTDKLRLDQVEPISSTASSQRFDRLELPEGPGLIERTIFATSGEFMPILDGKTLRKYVDQIIKLNLKTSPILLIDTRWETYVGSLKLNTVAFPKAKLLFEILHNKGFKIVLQIKPYMDTAIGIGTINQLFDEGKLYGTGSYDSSSVPKSHENWQGVNTDQVIRRNSLFKYDSETIQLEFNSSTNPFIFKCKESLEGYCTLLDLNQQNTRDWLIDSIRKSTLLSHEADAIMISGVHAQMQNWDDHYRSGVSDLVKSLFYQEKLYTISQWTGDFGYVQLAPRSFTWDSLRSLLGSILNIGSMGIPLVHPGSVWGDLDSGLQPTIDDYSQSVKPQVTRRKSIYGDLHSNERSEEELVIRWLQLSVFLPIIQFNNIAPIDKYNLHETLQSLIRMRKLFIVPEIKKHLPLTPLIMGSKPQLNTSTQQASPVIRPLWYNQEQGETIIAEQFMVGPDILVAPILSDGVRQRDIYLPSGFWQDELRQVKIRGGKWLRNYPVELNEVAWFTRTKR